jgi:hypothetical protein
MSFSQVDTLVTLPKSVTTRIIKDLVRLDHMDSLHAIDTQAIFFLTSTISLKDSVNAGQEKRIVNFEKMIQSSDTQVLLAEEQVSILEKQLRKEKRKKFIVGGIGIAAIVLLIL